MLFDIFPFFLNIDSCLPKELDSENAGWDQEVERTLNLKVACIAGSTREKYYVIGLAADE